MCVGHRVDTGHPPSLSAHHHKRWGTMPPQWIHQERNACVIFVHIMLQNSNFAPILDWVRIILSDLLVPSLLKSFNNHDVMFHSSNVGVEIKVLSSRVGNFYFYSCVKLSISLDIYVRHAFNIRSGFSQGCHSIECCQ